jgi:hypothetical protein
MRKFRCAQTIKRQAPTSDELFVMLPFNSLLQKHISFWVAMRARARRWIVHRKFKRTAKNSVQRCVKVRGTEIFRNRLSARRTIMGNCFGPRGILHLQVRRSLAVTGSEEKANVAILEKIGHRRPYRRDLEL